MSKQYRETEIDRMADVELKRLAGMGMTYQDVDTLCSKITTKAYLIISDDVDALYENKPLGKCK